MPSTDDSNPYRNDPEDLELPHTNGSSSLPTNDTNKKQVPNFSPVHLIVHLQEGVTIVFTNMDTYWKSIPREDKFTITSAKDFNKEERITDG